MTLQVVKKNNSASCEKVLNINKLKSSKEYYLRLLQLYKPWRNEYQLKECHQKYEEKYAKDDFKLKK